MHIQCNRKCDHTSYLNTEVHKHPAGRAINSAISEDVINSDTSISMGIYEKIFFLVFQVYRKCEHISMKLLGIQL